MTGKRDAVRNLPWVFLLVLVVGAALIAAVLIAARMTWITDLQLFQMSFFIAGNVAILSLSMVGHIWLFCRLSGRPIGDVRWPALVLHGAIIFPAPFLFIAAFFMALGGYFGSGDPVFLVWGGVALILIILEARLLGSRRFFLIFGSRSLEKRLGVAVFSGVFVWMLSMVLFAAALTGVEF